MFWSFHPEFHDILTKMPLQDELEAFVKCLEFAAAVWGLTKLVLLLLPVQTQLEYDCLKCNILQCLDQIHKQNRQYFRSVTHSSLPLHNQCVFAGGGVINMMVMEHFLNWLPEDADEMDYCHILALLKEEITLWYVHWQMDIFLLSFSLLPRKKRQIKPQNLQPNSCIPSLPILFLLLLSLCTKYRKWPPKWGTPKSMRSRV